MRNWLGILFVIVVLGIVMTVLRWIARRYQPHPELVRKLLHICMGLTTLSLPWLFDATWPALVLVGITVPGLWALRRVKRLKSNLGGVLHDVNRDDSLGEIYFPVGVAGAFIMAQGDALRFVVPILLLTASDSAAALVGVRYGHTQYTTADGVKSVEGSLAFFITAFLSVFIAMQFFFHGASLLETFLIATIFSLLVMLVEAVSWRGLDNFFVPVVGFLLFDVLLQLTLADLLGRLILTILLVLFALSWRGKAFLQDSALISAALIGYFCWTLADWRWFIAPVTIFISHLLLESATSWRDWWFGLRARLGIPKPAGYPSPLLLDEKLGLEPYSLFAVFSVASGGLFWLVAYRLLHIEETFYLFSLAFAAQLGILFLIAGKHRQRPEHWFFTLSHSIIWSWLLVFIPFFLIQGLARTALSDALLGLPGVALAVIAFYLLEPHDAPFYPADRRRWLTQALCTIVASLIGLIPLLLP